MTSGKQIGQRSAELSAGFITWKSYDYLFDYALYPFVIWRLGPWKGGALMAVLSLLISLLFLKIYDRLRRDWIGIEFVKGLRHYQGESRGLKILAWLISKGDLTAFLVLSIKFGPFITTAYLRHGAYNGMKKRDWGIFLPSWMLGNALWIFVCYGGVSCLRLLF